MRGHVLAAAIGLGLSHACFGDVIAMRFEVHVGGTAGVIDAFRPSLGLCNGGPSCLPPVAELFETLELTESDAGTTFVASAATDADFATVTAALTDGAEQRLSFSFASVPSLIGRARVVDESEVFGAENPDRIDLQGFRIDEIRMTVKALSLDTPGNDPGDDGRWTDFVIAVTFSFVGESMPLDGDCNNDLRIGTTDHFLQRACLAGPGQIAPVLHCPCADTNDDLRVDLRDVAWLQRRFGQTP